MPAGALQQAAITHAPCSTPAARCCWSSCTHTAGAGHSHACPYHPCCAEPELIDAGAYIIEPALDEILEEGIKRLQQKETWKVWQWPPDNADFFDADAFRQYMQVRRGRRCSWCAACSSWRQHTGQQAHIAVVRHLAQQLQVRFHAW
jgi:hypothetical protein